MNECQLQHKFSDISLAATNTEPITYDLFGWLNIPAIAYLNQDIKFVKSVVIVVYALYITILKRLRLILYVNKLLNLNGKIN